MGHFEIDNSTSLETPREWLRVGATITSLVNSFANRYNLVAKVGPNTIESYPACYKPLIAEIEVNTDIVFGKTVKPETVGDFMEKSTQFEFPKATGAILHEAMHARHSNWDLTKVFKELKLDEYEALNLLEESRIENRAILLNPDNKTFLRASALEIVVNDSEEKFAGNSTVDSAVFLVGTVLARVEAGVLELSEVETVREAIVKFIGEEALEKLIEIAKEFQNYSNDFDMTLAYPLAIRWAEIVRDLKKEKNETQQKSESGNDSSNSKNQDGAIQEIIKSFSKALSDSKEEVEIKNFSEVSEMEEKEEWKQVTENRKNQARQKNTNKEIAKQVFVSSTGESLVNKTDSTLVETRDPNAQERVASIKIAQLLEKAKYRERDSIDVNSVTPPGRLRTQKVFQGIAQKQRGVISRIEPWRKTVRKQTDEPTLTVGVMVDVSGSMNSAMQPMASTAWIMGEAVRRVQGKCAMVYYGNSVFPTLRSGERPNKVKVYTALDSTERFEKAFCALDGSLDLLYGRGAKLLVIVSDGNYTNEETGNAQKILKECERNGVGVLWLPIVSSNSASLICRNTNAVILPETVYPTEVATEIGKAAGKALEKMSLLVA